MPYVAIKAYPKDQATKEKIAERINEALMDILGCPPQAITISIEDVTPEDWVEQIVKPEIEPNKDKMLILSGEKRY